MLLFASIVFWCVVVVGSFTLIFIPIPGGDAPLTNEIACKLAAMTWLVLLNMSRK